MVYTAVIAGIGRVTKWTNLRVDDRSNIERVLTTVRFIYPSPILKVYPPEVILK